MSKEIILNYFQEIRAVYRNVDCTLRNLLHPAKQYYVAWLDSGENMYVFLLSLDQEKKALLSTFLSKAFGCPLESVEERCRNMCCVIELVTAATSSDMISKVGGDSKTSEFFLKLFQRMGSIQKYVICLGVHLDTYASLLSEKIPVEAVQARLASTEPPKFGKVSVNVEPEAKSVQVGSKRGFSYYDNLLCSMYGTKPAEPPSRHPAKTGGSESDRPAPSVACLSPRQGGSIQIQDCSHPKKGPASCSITISGGGFSKYKNILG